LKKKALLSVAAMCASFGASAADVSQTINPLVEATKIMDRCAAIANKISGTKVPAGHAEAVAAAFANEQAAKAPATAGGAAKSGAAAGAGAAPASISTSSGASANPNIVSAEPEAVKVIAPNQQAFFVMVRGERLNLQNCGMEYAKVSKAADAVMKSAGDAMEKNPAKTASDDDKKVAAAMAAYGKSSENLATAITSLSKDLDHQRYVGATVNKYFLGRD
jgi:hypothetical protein